MRSGSRPAAAFLLALLALGPGAMAGDDDETVWPNKKSRANSDAWLVQNHDKLRLMKPRVLVLNFANGLSREEAAKKVDELRSALGVSSRWHGGPSWAARSPRQGDPAFLDYQVAKQVELTD
ncbi:hypothetical protein HY251_03420, partial [bacterium]|nr:hypothetical protein [bacterium]